MTNEAERLRAIIRNYVKAEDEYLNAYPETDTSQLKQKVDEAWKVLRNEAV
jgi:ribosomal 50S subunit-associated protein YjgA (DUF615 family)